jgi:hypothetical protein
MLIIHTNRGCDGTVRNDASHGAHRQPVRSSSYQPPPLHPPQLPQDICANPNNTVVRVRPRRGSAVLIYHTLPNGGPDLLVRLCPACAGRPGSPWKPWDDFSGHVTTAVHKSLPNRIWPSQS